MQIKPEKKVCLLVVIQTQGLLPSESMFFVNKPWPEYKLTKNMDSLGRSP